MSPGGRRKEKLGISNRGRSDDNEKLVWASQLRENSEVDVPLRLKVAEPSAFSTALTVRSAIAPATGRNSTAATTKRVKILRENPGRSPADSQTERALLLLPAESLEATFTGEEQFELRREMTIA
jgi:hypothetical protein